MELTGYSIHQVESLLTDEDRLAQGDAGLHVRLAMLAKGENPADSDLVGEIINWPAPDYLDYIEPYTQAIARDAQATFNEDGTVSVVLDDRTVVVRHLKGREVPLLLSDSNRVPRMVAMTDLTLEEVHALPLWAFAALEGAMRPLVSAVLTKIVGGNLSPPSSG